MLIDDRRQEAGVKSSKNDWSNLAQEEKIKIQNCFNPNLT